MLCVLVFNLKPEDVYDHPSLPILKQMQIKVSDICDIFKKIIFMNPFLKIKFVNNLGDLINKWQK